MNNNSLALNNGAHQTVSLPQPAQLALRGVTLTGFEEMMRFADVVVQSGLAPKGFTTPPQVFIALQCGAEFGFSPMQSLQAIGVINGRPGPFGEALPAMVLNSGKCDKLEEWFECGGTSIENVPWVRLDQFPLDFEAVVVSQRRGSSRERVTRFSVADAKRANLWGKQGPWSQYPQRMLRFRALTFNLRDEFPDVTRGFISVEEMRDIPVPGEDHATQPPVGRVKAVRQGQPAAVPEPAEVAQVEATQPEPTSGFGFEGLQSAPEPEPVAVAPQAAPEPTPVPAAAAAPKAAPRAQAPKAAAPASPAPAAPAATQAGDVKMPSAKDLSEHAHWAAQCGFIGLDSPTVPPGATEQQVRRSIEQMQNRHNAELRRRGFPRAEVRFSSAYKDFTAAANEKGMSWETAEDVQLFQESASLAFGEEIIVDGLAESWGMIAEAVREGRIAWGGPAGG